MKKFHLLVLPFVVVATADPIWAEEFGNTPGYECTILYGGTTCRQIITAWGEDIGLSFDEAVTNVSCSGCEPKTATDIAGAEYVLWFKCKNRNAHYLESLFLDKHVSKFRGANSEGFHVGSFAFSKCLATYQCFEFCSTQTDPPRCIISSGAWIGRWNPLIAGLCGEPLYEEYE